MSENDDIIRLRDAVRDYVEHNPNAADTLEGIARWWLASGPGQINRDRLQKALDSLVSAKVLQGERKQSGELIYTCSRKIPRTD